MTTSPQQMITTSVEEQPEDQEETCSGESGSQDCPYCIGPETD
jgi:hypothetical protein